MAHHSFGYVPSPIDDRDRMAVGGEGALFGSPTHTSRLSDQTYKMIPLIPGVLDQAQSNTCVWQALQTEHHICQKLQGVANPQLLSRLFGYWHTRFRTGHHRRDEGCIPREAWKAAAGMGFCREPLWPFEMSRVQTPPDFDATSGAVDQKWLTGYYAIWGVLRQRDEEVRIALNNDHPVVFGTLVDNNFDTFVSPKPTTLGIPRGMPIGRHMMCGVGYDTDGLWCVNSWGLRWGCPDPTNLFPGGFFRMSWEWVNWAQATDWWALSHAKEFSP